MYKARVYYCLNNGLSRKGAWYIHNIERNRLMIHLDVCFIRTTTAFGRIVYPQLLIVYTALLHYIRQDSYSEYTHTWLKQLCNSKLLLSWFYAGALGYITAYFGEGSGPIHIDHIMCSGIEYSLTECEIRNRTRQTDHGQDVGVKCNTGIYV